MAIVTTIRIKFMTLVTQSTVFRTFQGWLAMSETGPSQGTLKVFPDVLLSNAYIMMRPFFRPVASSESQNPLDAKNWEYGGAKPFNFLRGSSDSDLF